MAVDRFFAAARGVSESPAGANLNKEEALALENLLVDQPGKLVMRGPYGDATSLWTTGSDVVQGFWRYDTSLLVQGGSDAKLVAWDGSGSADAVSVTGSIGLRHRSARVGNYAYATGLFDISTPTTSGRLRRWDGSTNGPLQHTPGPHQGVDVAAHLERLFVANCTVPGTTTPTIPNLLTWSDVGGPLRTASGVTGVASTDLLTKAAHGLAVGDPVTFTSITGGTGLTPNTQYYVIATGHTANDFKVSATPGGAAVNFTSDVSAATFETDNTLDGWKDDVSSVVNQIRVGSPGDPIVALASVGRQLVIFKQNSIYVALGDSPTSFTLRRIANTVGCADALTTIVFDDVCVFRTETDDWMLYDGAALQPLGRPPTWSTPTQPTIARLPQGYLLISEGRQDDGDCWLLHVATRAWSKVTASGEVLAPAGGIGGSTWLANAETGGASMIDGNQIRAASDLTARLTPLDAQGRESIRTSGAEYRVIPARWKTRVARLALPFAKARISRIYVDHNTKSEGVGTALPEWNVDVTAADGSAVYSTTIEAVADADQVSMQAVGDTNAEATAILVEATYQVSGEPAESTAELHDIWVEYEPAQKQKSF